MTINKEVQFTALVLGMLAVPAMADQAKLEEVFTSRREAPVGRKMCGLSRRPQSGVER